MTAAVCLIICQSNTASTHWHRALARPVDRPAPVVLPIFCYPQLHSGLLAGKHKLDAVT